jgi:hypothetical protein
MTGCSPARSANRRLAILYVAILLLFFGTVSWLAVSAKSPTFDEPAESVAGWVQFWHRDFRLDTDAGALWHDFVGVANSPHALQPDFSNPNWTKSLQEHTAGWKWAIRTLYGSDGNDPDRFIGHARLMMLGLGMGLGLLICAFAWRLAGPSGAVMATALYCLDPNFIAHAPLVKSDVAFSLALLAFIAAVWSAGETLTLPKLLGIGLLFGIAITIKWSAALILPILIVLLFLRAIMRRPWRILGRELNSRLGRMTAAIGVAAFIGIIGCAFVWFVYTFRFAPTSDPSVSLSSAEMIDLDHRAEFRRRNSTDNPTPLQLAQIPTPPLLIAAGFLEGHRLLPQSFLHGFLYTYESSLLRNSYLLGEVSIFGHWFYFPLAMLFKTPLATLIAGGLVAIMAAVFIAKTRPLGFAAIWKALCLFIPTFIFLLAAMASNLNIGIRHVLAVYPLAYIAAGVIVAGAWRTWPWARRSIGVVGGMLLILLTAETLSAFPNYIAFFNTAAGGTSGGIRLLGDSNLDWGQDLILLAGWQRDHPDAPLYLSYFGSVDPARYGIRYISLPGSTTTQFEKPHWPSKPGYMAISATQLQGIWMQQSLWEQFYRQFGKLKPVDILGGTIYIYPFPPTS